MAVFRKDSAAELDYRVDWTEWLGTDNIVSSQATAFPGTPLSDTSLIVASASVSGGQEHIIWLSAGTTANQYRVQSKITTSVGRTNLRSFLIRVENT